MKALEYVINDVTSFMYKARLWVFPENFFDTREGKKKS